MRRPDSNSVERCAPYPGFRRKTPDLHSCLRSSKSILNPPDSSSNRMRREARKSELSHATTQRRDLIFVAADKTRAAVRKDACGLVPLATDPRTAVALSKCRPGIGLRSAIHDKVSPHLSCDH